MTDSLPDARDDAHAEAKKEALRVKWRRIIFDHDTKAGNAFDVLLIIAILGSVGVVMADSMSGLSPRTHYVLYVLEWVFTILFTAEYIARLWCAAHPARYARSFFGVVDLLATLPTYISLIFPGGRFLALVRILRVMRVFRILKLTKYVEEAGVLGQALAASKHKVIVFMFTVITLVVIVGSLMFVIEGAEAGFTSIPMSMYWAIVTVTTVGYGDIAPLTTAGRMLASLTWMRCTARSAGRGCRRVGCCREGGDSYAERGEASGHGSRRNGRSRAEESAILHTRWPPPRPPRLAPRSRMLAKVASGSYLVGCARSA
jgi:voltage-gated potassium channel